MCHGARRNLDKEVCELNAGAAWSTKLQHAIATRQPPQHHRLIGDLLSAIKSAIGHRHAEERGVRLGRHTMNRRLAF